MPRGDSVPKVLPAILLVHGGPGLPSRYLEPLAARLRAPVGRTCYAYDQLGCGLSSVDGGQPKDGLGLQRSIQDLRDVLRFLSQDLGVAEVHLMGHGFGGALIMEALLRAGLWDEPQELPRLLSVCLLGTPSSTAVAESEARRLMRRVEAAVGQEDAPRAFWYRHNCGLKPQPLCLREAYAQAAERSTGWWGFGALQGWAWKLGVAGAPGHWELKGSGVLPHWRMESEEVAERYGQATGNAPFLLVRGAHDFVTAECVEAWQAVRHSRAPFHEEVMDACGHNAHLEDPEAFAAKLRLWLLHVEAAGGADGGGGTASEMSSLDGYPSRAVPVQGSIRLLGQAEARRRLVTWASELSWAAASGLYAEHRRAVRWAQGVYKAANPLAREARCLAEWARGLPRGPEPQGTDAEVIGRALRGQRGCPRVALGWAAAEGGALEAIVCLEAAGAAGRGVGLGRRGLLGTGLPEGLRVVGAAAAPAAPAGMRDAALQSVSQLISGPPVTAQKAPVAEPASAE